MRRSSSARRRGTDDARRSLVGSRRRPRRRRRRALPRGRTAGSAEFGTPVLTFLEPTAVGQQRERRVLYETGEDVDFPLLALSALDRLEVAAAVARPRLPACSSTRSASRRVWPRSRSRARPELVPTQEALDGARERLLVPRALGGEEAAPRRGLHRDRVPRRVHEGPARHAARVACARGRPVRRHVARRPVPRALGGSGRALRARARVRPLRPARRRTGSVGDDRPLPGPRGGDGAPARARGRARPRRPEPARSRGRPRSEARGIRC